MKSQEGLLVLSGEAPSEHNTNGLSDKQSYSKNDSERGMLFTCAVKADTDGKKHVSGKGIEITGATAVTLCLTAETSFNGWQTASRTSSPALRDSKKTSTTKLSRRHISPTTARSIRESSLT